MKDDPVESVEGEGAVGFFCVARVTADSLRVDGVGIARQTWPLAGEPHDAVVTVKL